MPHDLPGRLGEPDLAGPPPSRASRSATAHRLADDRSGVGRAARGHDLAGADAGARAQAERQRLDPGAQLRRARGAARSASSSCATGMPSTASDRVVAPLDDACRRAVAQTARVASWKRLEHGAQRLRVGARRLASAPVSWRRRRSPSDGCRPRPARARGGGAGSGTSWRRIADSSARSSGDGSIPSPSTSARWASRYASSASACRPAAVEREHQLTAQPLAQRVLADERLELAGDLGVPSAGEVGLDPRAEAAEAQIVEPRDLGLGEALVGDVGQRRPAPELERVPQRRRRLPRLAARELLAPAPQSAARSGRRRARPAGVERGSRRPRRRPGRRPAPPAARDATTWTALRAFCGPAPSHSSSTTRSRWTAAPWRTSSSARSERARPRGTRTIWASSSISMGPRILNWTSTSPPSLYRSATLE